MIEKIYLTKLSHTDLNMYRYGIEDCSPGHSWGPAVRDHFIIHYVLKGKGIFQFGDKTYHLGRGEGFLIYPDTIVHYKADLEDPWSYSWVGFNGIKADAYLKQAGFSSESPTFKYDGDSFIEDCFKQMIATKSMTKGREAKLLGILYNLLSRLIEYNPLLLQHLAEENLKENYVKKAIEFIAMNYSGKVSIAELSHYVGLDRSYFYTIFNDYLKVSPQEFLINFRVNKACELMEKKSLSIGDISRSVGYEDPLLFSKIFKRIKGQSPREYRKTL